MDKILGNIGIKNRSLGLQTGYDYLESTNDDISEENINFEECTR